jgi:hypothetical protein
VVSSSFNVYYCYLDVKNKSLHNTSKDFSERTANYLWQYKTQQFIKDVCKNIYNDIENSRFSYRDFKVYLFYSFLYNSKFYITNYQLPNVILINKLFKDDQFEKDQQFIKELNKNIILDNEKLFTFNLKGETHIYSLIKDKYISPNYWIKNKLVFDNIKQVNEENKEHKQFRRIMSLIEKEVCYA